MHSEKIEHLEAMRALADETADGVAGYTIERAPGELEALMWPEPLLPSAPIVLAAAFELAGLSQTTAE